jgi:hypothetical protein
MRAGFGAATTLIVATMLVSVAPGPLAQQAEFTNNFKYNRGQAIQPIFEGWSWAPDGSINMHFGYLNRNYAEQPEIPIGANNRIEPGGPDRGQPTYFYSRTNRNLFTVNVPKTFGPKDEVVWTVTFNGFTERAVGWRQAEWEIDPVGGASAGGSTDPERVANKPPSLKIEPPAPIRLPATASLAVVIEDDGLPKPRPRGKPPVGQETPPTLQGGTSAPVNVPQAALRLPPAGGATGAPSERPLGMVVTWIVWRGPADVRFTPRYTQPKDGRAQTQATFSVPGEYVLRATADDGAVSRHAQATIKVSGGTATTGPR